jgi:hypothetical protein
MSRVRWRVLVAVTAGLMGASAVLSGTAGASSAAPASGISGVKGDPQPELKPFKIAALGSGGANAAVEKNGALVVAYAVGTANGAGKTVVCVLARGASKCSSSVTLTPLDGDDLESTPVVFAPSANHVVVLTGTCCDGNPNGGDLVYTSVNGGKTFGAPVRVGGTVGISAAALIGGQIVFDSGGDGGGALVESIPVAPGGPPAETASPITAVSYNIGVGSYQGGALVASQYDGSAKDYTYVDYAPAGKNFNATGSYHGVGTFAGEDLVAVSGSALLTQETSGAEALVLRLFNGTKFGPAHLVPKSGGGGPEWFSLDQDPSGRSHVFSDRAFAPVSYDLYIQTTVTGATWTSPLDLGDGSVSNYFGEALDSIGSGVAVGTSDHYPVWVFPVLAPQGVSFGLAKSTIGKGHSTVGAGKGSPIAKGRVVALQVERSGEWWTVATTHETSSGSFSFTIKGSAAGTYDYRAVVSDFAGYLQYGYSAARVLKVS